LREVGAVTWESTVRREVRVGVGAVKGGTGRVEWSGERAETETSKSVIGVR
jgi:hypothetical protein